VNNTASGLYSFDISWVDTTAHRYYLADRSNNAVDIVNTTTNTLIFRLGVSTFAGVSPPAVSPGPNGVAASGPCLFVTDAPSRVAAYITTPYPPTSDNNVPTFVNAVSTDPSSLLRADELAVDPVHSLILAINNADVPPFGTFISFNPATCRLTQPSSPGADRITFTTATGGAEQPVWDPSTGKFYLSIPQTAPPASKGAVFRIDPTSKMIDFSYPVTFCSPAGLTKGPGNDLLIGCNTIWDTAGGLWNAADPNTAAPIQVILDVRTGAQLRVGFVGVGDEVWFDSQSGNYYTASSTSPLRPLDVTGAADAQGAAILGVINATAGQLAQLVPTFNVPATPPPLFGPAGHPAGTAHSVAVDGEPTTRVYVPLAANNVYPDCLQGCIAVYAPVRIFDEATPEAVFPPP
jgi:hypothetical protein